MRELQPIANQNTNSAANPLLPDANTAAADSGRYGLGNVSSNRISRAVSLGTRNFDGNMDLFSPNASGNISTSNTRINQNNTNPNNGRPLRLNLDPNTGPLTLDQLLLNQRIADANTTTAGRREASVLGTQLILLVLHSLLRHR